MSYDDARKKKSTDYAKCMGIFVYVSEGSDWDGNSVWWLRSPGVENTWYASDVYYIGSIYAYFVSFTSMGFLPASYIKI